MENVESLTAAEVMSHPPVTVTLDATLDVARALFERHHFHHLLVVDHDVLVGVMSDRDLFKALSPYLETASENARDLATLHKHVHQVMGHQPISTPPETPLADLVRIFTERRVSCVPVVNRAGQPIGLVSWRDLLRVWSGTPAS